jgi:hypothetical protein
MNVRSLKLAGAAAGLLFLVGAAPDVYAQTAVLNLDNSVAGGFRSAIFYSTFTLNRSMILNSVGFISINNSTIGAQNHNYFYKIGTSAEQEITDESTLSSVDASGVRYFTFVNPQTYAEGTEVRIRSQWIVGNNYLFRPITSTNSVGVTHTASVHGSQGVVYAAGNIKVSEPGSNVAPEPGSIALLLTGGGALAGIALRRRRNAA